MNGVRLRIWCWHVARIISSQKIYGFYGLKHRIVEIRGDVTMRDKRQTSEDGATQPMDAGGWVSQWAASSWSASSLYLPAPPGQKDTFFKSHNISSVWLGSVLNSSDGLIFVKIRAKYGRFFSKNTCKIKVFVIVVFCYLVHVQSVIDLFSKQLNDAQYFRKRNLV